MGLLRNIKQVLLDKINPILAPVHYPVAVRRLRELEQTCLQRDGDLFQVPFEYRGPGVYHPISPTQIVEEIRALFLELSQIAPRNTCEIGTDKGGTFYLLCKASAADGHVVSIDQPSRVRYSPARRRMYAEFRRAESQRIDFLPGDSHDPRTLQALRCVLNGEDLDFLLIDGDHTYEGVRQDYEMYSPAVRKDGLIAFHDIRTVREDCGVPQFWSEIKGRSGWHREIVASEEAGPLGCGIGLVRRS